MKIRRILSVFLLTVLMVSLMLTPQAYALPALLMAAGKLSVFRPARKA